MNESEIIRGCKRERAKYQKELVLRYSPMMMTVARRYCRDDHAAKDVLQEAFIRIFKAIHKYEATGSFKGWLHRIVINVALQSLGKLSYRKEQTAIDDIVHPMMAPKVIEDLQAEELIRLIQQLPNPYRTIFNLYVLEGFSHNEIAKMLDIAPSTSRSQLTRAKQKLQAMILIQEKKNYVKRVG